MRHAEGASAVRSAAKHRSKAQPVARRPERSEGHAQKSNMSYSKYKLLYHYQDVTCFSSFFPILKAFQEVF
ncbi:MAG: hypothetical protein NZ455_09870 [Bacteroidia bacterium]|nr:hypothetical protein [Bacteroidia bacterium]MDW8346658.1 hypothetical protein [Bacteroidia bacterium]